MATILLGFSGNELSPQDLGCIKQLVPNLQILVTTDRRIIEQRLDEIEIAVKEFPQALLSRAPKLRWFQQWGAGADWILKQPDIVESDVVITNASGVHAIPITEHIFALMLAMGRNLHRAIRAQAHGEWHRPDWDNLFELAGKTMVLIGVGAIGAQTSRIAAAFGMRVLGVRRDPTIHSEGVAAMHSPDQLPDLLPQADFVVITAPLTPETQRLIGEPELNAMKASAILVNIGRGSIIDEPALVRALQEGRLGGAGLDVFASEPLPSQSPLWALENVIITSHYAGATPHYHERAMEIFLDNLRRYVAGEPLRNVVDKTLGY